MSSQIQIVSMDCVKCGAMLEIHPDMEHFSCGYCGASLMVERKGGAVVLKLKQLVEAVAKVQIGTDKTAAELAINRLLEEKKEIEGKLVVIRKNINDEIWKHSPGEMTFLMGLVSAVLFICGCVFLYLALHGMSEAIGYTCFCLFIAIALAFIVYSVIQDHGSYANNCRERLKEIEKPFFVELAAVDEKIKRNKNIVDSD